MERIPLEDITLDRVRREAVTDYCRWLICRYHRGGPRAAATLFAETFPEALYKGAVLAHVAEWEKTVVLPGTTADDAWAGVLAGPQKLREAFVALIKRDSVLGQMPIVAVPFRTPFPRETTGANFGWRAENAPKIVMSFAYDRVFLDVAVAAGIVALTSEMLTAAPGAEPAIEQSLRRDIRAFVDAALLSTAAPVGWPKGLLNGVVPIAASGNLGSDLAALLNAFFTANPNASAPTILTSAALVHDLGSLPNQIDVRATGESFVSGVLHLVTPAAAGNLIILDAHQVFVADAGIVIDMSKHATPEMAAPPTSPPTAATIMTSLWENNLVGVRCERLINWTATAGSIAYVAGV